MSFVPRRGAHFFVVGAAGVIVQAAALAFLVHIAAWPWLPATIVAVECAIVHNFVWHVKWTWKDRFVGFAGFGEFAGFAVGSFVRFNASTAVTSLVGNVALMALLVGAAGLPVVAANVIAVVLVSVVNFVIADRWVFALGPVFLLALAPSVASAAPKPAAVAAWTKYVAATEERLARTTVSGSDNPCETRDGVAAWGETIPVESGTISHWRGAVFIPNLTVAQLIHRLQHPGTPPPQEDVTASRVIARGPDSLHVYMRLVRRAIVTVTYDTEHQMSFHRWSDTLATARSIATSIHESGGDDHGFLWKLHSYWRYQQVGSGVAVSVESLTLSRDVPALVRPIAGRLVPRIARESMVRTLDALRRYFERSA